MTVFHPNPDPVSQWDGVDPDNSQIVRVLAGPFTPYGFFFSQVGRIKEHSDGSAGTKLPKASRWQGGQWCFHWRRLHDSACCRFQRQDLHPSQPPFTREAFFPLFQRGTEGDSATLLHGNALAGSAALDPAYGDMSSRADQGAQRRIRRNEAAQGVNVVWRSMVFPPRIGLGKAQRRHFRLWTRGSVDSYGSAAPSTSINFRVIAHLIGGSVLPSRSTALRSSRAGGESSVNRRTMPLVP